jgi:succinate dehydrogenase / fumarate reductase membrane anchor subunit
VGWLFMRISGLLLLVLAVGHTLIMHLPAGGVDRINFGFVAVRWESPFWRTWDWLLLILALLHGINGSGTSRSTTCDAPAGDSRST